MQYLMLIYHGNEPDMLSGDQRDKVAADYAALNHHPGVTAGLPMARPENASTVQVKDGTTLTTEDI